MMMEGVRMGPCQQATAPSSRASATADESATALTVDIEKNERGKLRTVKQGQWGLP